MSIKISLDKLDPANEEHWTSDGLPRLDVLKKMSGNVNLTRKQVTDADPSFTRASVLEAEKVEEATDEAKLEIVADILEEAVKADPEVMVAAEAPTEAETLADAATPAEAPEIATQAPEMAAPVPSAVPTPALTKMQALQAQLAVHEEAMLDADRVKEAADKAMKISSDEVNAINRQIEAVTKADPQAATAGIRDYIAMQNKLRMDRAMNAQRLVGDTGTRPSDIVKALEIRSPIDKAFKGRKPPRGTIRPQTRG